MAVIHVEFEMEGATFLAWGCVVGGATRPHAYN